MPFRDWLLQSVRYFRRLGFFKRYAFASDDELAEELHERGWDGNPNPSSGVNDLALLAMDDHVVWWRDTEADAIMGNEVYVTTLLELSAISRGAFMPKNIEEIWATKDGPVEIRFALRGKATQIQAESLTDYIDLRILPRINALIQDKGIQFELYEPFDQSAFVMALTAEEKRRLQSERGWQFEVL